MRSDVAAVFFDVDNTLYDYERSVAIGLEEVARRVPGPFDGVPLPALEGAYFAAQEVIEATPAVKLLEHDVFAYRCAFFAEVLAQRAALPMAPPWKLPDEKPRAALAERLATAFESNRAAHWRAAQYEGAQELVAALRARVPVGIITNGPSGIQRAKVRGLGYADTLRPELVFVSGEFGVRKPHPSIFEAAAKAASVSPTDVLFVGDSPEFDIGSKAAGMKFALFNGKPQPPPVFADGAPRPDVILGSYRELRDFLGLVS
ncbi:MAG: HAD family hydrolase [Thermoplasmatota archaeon]